MLRGEADRQGIIVVAPDSRSRRTWDNIVRGDYGPDISFIDTVLGHVFGRFRIDARRIAVGGFSDGASYALSIGLMNGELFRNVLAFSPGFAAPVRRVGKPKIFISHGISDTVLPIDRCGRLLARKLSREGYPVDYREFDGGHVVPPEMIEAAVRQMMIS